MESIIDRREALNTALTNYGAHELYVNEDFEMGDDNPTIAILANPSGSPTLLYTGVRYRFGDKTLCSVTTNPHAACLQGLKIAWRDGVWYV